MVQPGWVIVSFLTKLFGSYGGLGRDHLQVSALKIQFKLNNCDYHLSVGLFERHGDHQPSPIGEHVDVQQASHTRALARRGGQRQRRDVGAGGHAGTVGIRT